jgi:hypothetical protein
LIRAIDLSGSTIYAAGSFTKVEGQQRRIVAIDTRTAAIDSWDPAVDYGYWQDGVATLLATSSGVYVGGDFDGYFAAFPPAP